MFLAHQHLLLQPPATSIIPRSLEISLMYLHIFQTFKCGAYNILWYIPLADYDFTNIASLCGLLSQLSRLYQFTVTQMAIMGISSFSGLYCNVDVVTCRKPINNFDLHKEIYIFLYNFSKCQVSSTLVIKIVTSQMLIGPVISWSGLLQIICHCRPIFNDQFYQIICVGYVVLITLCIVTVGTCIAFGFCGSDALSCVTAMIN